MNTNISLLFVIFLVLRAAKANNNRTRRFAFWPSNLGNFGSNLGGGFGGFGGSQQTGSAFSTPLIGGGVNNGLFGYNQQFQPNRISDCPTTEFNRTGICVTSAYECRGRGGRVVGQCYATPLTGSSGFSGSGDSSNNDYYNRRIPAGFCCVYQVTCGGTILQNGTYFRSPNAPATYNDARACSATIPKLGPSICQIRLDFVTFSLKPPTAGVCDVDKLIIDGQSQNNHAPALCGFNAGQHMYVDVDRGHNPITLTALTGTGSVFNRHFDIRVTYIHCLSPYRAPPNCLQYYYDLNGEFRSFNFDYYSQNSAKYLRSLDYAICFRKLPGFCSITYSMPKFGVASSEEGGQQQPRPQQTSGKYFNVVNNVAAGIGNGGAGPAKCPDDYLVLSTHRLCGMVLNDDIERGSSPTTGMDITDSGSGPIIARFVTNDDDMVGFGFFLQYRLNHCFFGGR
ncbi:hypothetical protein HDE_11638 [Halotydeus destructor]|nr:hypothetical protein HDE_11638 [Halotydeus destructor]